MNTIRANASQPQIAFLRFRALQWAIRAATLTVCFDEVMDILSSWTRAFGADRWRSTRHAGRGVGAGIRPPGIEAVRKPTIHLPVRSVGRVRQGNPGLDWSR